MKNKAFTLIELLVVITIIGILSGIVMVAVSDEAAKARIAASQRFSHSIRTRLALDMVGRWPFDFSTADFSGFNNHGTPLDDNHANADGNTPPQFTQGVTGQALSFDGVDDFVRITHTSQLDFGLNSFSIEAWIKRTGAGIFDGVVYKMITSAHLHGYGLGIESNGAIRFDVRDGAGRISNRGTIVVGEWTHLVMVVDRERHLGFIFRNGQQQGVSISLVGHGSYATPGALAIGAHAEGGDHPFDGLIDEVRIFRAAVPASYIQKRYVEGVKSLAANSGITQEEKQQRIAELRNSGQLVIDLDAALAGPIDFSPYAHYFETLALEATE